MDSDNQTATLIHEAIYALIRPEPLNVAKSAGSQFTQNGARVREIVGHFFNSRSWKSMQVEGSWFVIDPKELPISYGYADRYLADPRRKFPMRQPHVTVASAMNHLRLGGVPDSGNLHTILVNYDLSLVAETNFEKDLAIGNYAGDKVWWVAEQRCRLRRHSPVRAFFRLQPQQHSFSPTSPIALRFENYTEGSQIKTYVSFRSAEKVPSVDLVEIIKDPKDMEDCVEQFMKAFWRVIVSVDPFDKYSGERSDENPLLQDVLREIQNAR